MRQFVIAVACLFVAAPPASAASLSVTRKFRYASAAEVASDPALYGHVVANYFLTSTTDIISVDNVVITPSLGTLYQNALGSDNEPPNPALLGLFPALTADSWISTPGATNVAGGGFANANSSWFDTDNSGPQTNFNYARLTFRFGSAGNFGHRINTLSDDGLSVVNFPIEFTLEEIIITPEPAGAVLAGVGMVAFAGFRRRT